MTSNEQRITKAPEPPKRRCEPHGRGN